MSLLCLIYQGTGETVQGLQLCFWGKWETIAGLWVAVVLCGWFLGTNFWRALKQSVLEKKTACYEEIIAAMMGKHSWKSTHTHKNILVMHEHMMWQAEHIQELYHDLSRVTEGWKDGLL